MGYPLRRGFVEEYAALGRMWKADLICFSAKPSDSEYLYESRTDESVDARFFVFSESPAKVSCPRRFE